MSGKAEGGLRGALELDQAARQLASDLDRGRAAAAKSGEAGDGAPGAPGDGGADPDAAQLGLFAGESVFGQIRRPDGVNLPRSGPGRPRGSTNRTTRDLVKLITATGKHPLLAMAEIVSTPIDVIAATLCCTRLEAAEYHRKVMSDLAPYVGQKMPTAVQIAGANAGLLVINLGGPLGEAAKGLDMRLIEGEAQPVDFQALSGDEAGSPHDVPPHEEGK